ncbi:MAG: hypothetical protein ABI456_08570 [Ktedonobacteraceae bacterium]
MKHNLSLAGFERPLGMIHTPIDHLYTEELIAFLERHGARVSCCSSGEYDACLPDGARARRPYSTYDVTFPAGSRRIDSLSLMWTTPFTIIFPDGASIKAVEQHPLDRHDEGKTILYLARP